MASVFLHLASLSMIISRSTHIDAHGTISFFSWPSGTPLCVCTASPLSIQHLSGTPLCIRTTSPLSIQHLSGTPLCIRTTSPLSIQHLSGTPLCVCTASPLSIQHVSGTPQCIRTTSPLYIRHLSGTPLCICTASPLPFSICQWTSRWRPRLGHCEQFCYEHGGGGDACIKLAKKVVRVFH